MNAENTTRLMQAVAIVCFMLAFSTVRSQVPVGGIDDDWIMIAPDRWTGGNYNVLSGLVENLKLEGKSKAMIMAFSDLRNRARSLDATIFRWTSSDLDPVTRVDIAKLTNMDQMSYEKFSSYTFEQMANTIILDHPPGSEIRLDSVNMKLSTAGSRSMRARYEISVPPNKKVINIYHVVFRPDFVHSFVLTVKKANSTPVISEFDSMLASLKYKGSGDTAEALKELMERILRSLYVKDYRQAEDLCARLVLTSHELWFNHMFGSATGDALSREYGQQVANLDRALVDFFEGMLRKGRTRVMVTRLESPTDPNATGRQQTVLAAMRKPIPLYSVRFIEPGKEYGTHIYSFAYIDNHFRMLGKMSAAGK